MKNLITKIALPFISLGIIGASCGKEETEKPEVTKPDTVQFVQKPEPVKPPMPLVDSLTIYHDSIYTVKAGDNGVDGIGYKVYGYEVMGRAIANWNNLQLYVYGSKVISKLTPGMKLKIKPVEIRKIQERWGWGNIANDVGISIDEAQERFRWIGTSPVLEDIYYVDREVEKPKRSKYRHGGGIISVD